MEPSTKEQEESESSVAEQKTDDLPPLRLGLRFDTKYNEQTGLLHAFNLGVERFQPGKEGFDQETQRYTQLYTRSDSIPKPDDESGWSGQQDGTLTFYNEKGVDVASLLPGTLIHVLFHYHDNYCDSSLAFLDRAKAELAFHEFENGMWDEIEMYRSNNSAYDWCVVKRDKWHCDLLECELAGRRWDRGLTRPDKGSTWWLRSVVLE